MRKKITFVPSTRIPITLHVFVGLELISRITLALWNNVDILYYIIYQDSLSSQNKMKMSNLLCKNFNLIPTDNFMQVYISAKLLTPRLTLLSKEHVFYDNNYFVKFNMEFIKNRYGINKG